MRTSERIFFVALVLACLASPVRPAAAQPGCTQCDGDPCNGAVCFNGPYDASKCAAFGCGILSRGYMVPCDQASGNPCTLIDPTPASTPTAIPTPTEGATEKPAPVASFPVLALLVFVLVACSVWRMRSDPRDDHRG